MCLYTVRRTCTVRSCIIRPLYVFTVICDIIGISVKTNVETEGPRGQKYPCGGAKKGPMSLNRSLHRGLQNISLQPRPTKNWGFFFQSPPPPIPCKILILTHSPYERTPHKAPPPHAPVRVYCDVDPPKTKIETRAPKTKASW
jgi:hypothetical protein